MPRVLNLLPGWGFHASVWEGLLANLGTDWTPNLVELPWGVELSRWTVADGPIAEQLRPGWCLGWSLGGTLALALASCPGVAGVALLASTPRWLREPGWPSGLDSQQLDELEGQLQDEPQAALRQFAALAAVGAAHPARIRSALQHHQLPAARSQELAHALGLLRKLDVRRLSARVPVAAILGGGDRLLPQGLPREWLQSLASGEAIVLPETGHAPLLSDAPGVAAALSRLVPS